MAAEQLSQDIIGGAGNNEQVRYSSRWWLKFGFQATVGKGPDVRFQIVTYAANIAENLPSFPDLK